MLRFTVVASYATFPEIPIYFGTLQQCRYKILELCGVFPAELKKTYTPNTYLPTKYRIVYNNKKYNKILEPQKK